MEAGFLESPFGPLFAAYHPPEGASVREVAVIFCDPFGSDRMNLHLAYRALALHLAELGFPVLRLDYPGTCDSAGSPRDPKQVASWLRALGLGADWLKARAGVATLGAFGALLGGTVATVFAASRPDVRALALWGAYPSGRAFLREVKAFEAMRAGNRGGARPARFAEGDQEAIGFLITAETAEAIRALDALKTGAPIAERAAIFRRNARASVEPLAGHLRGAGVEVEVEPEATVDMAAFSGEPVPLPRAFVEAFGRWWSEAYPARRARPSPGHALARVAHVRAEGGRRVREEVLRFGDDGGLFGILTSPVADARVDRPAVLLVNGGGNHRAGINRNHTEWARAWAERGLTVLRMDIRGLGDSPADPRAPWPVLYRGETRADVQAALDLLSGRFGFGRVVAVGLCAGAYQAFHAALGDPRIEGLVMLNPLRFQRPEERATGERGELEYAPLAHYLRAAIDLGAWRRLALERRDPRVFARFVARRLHARAAAGARALAVMGLVRPLESIALRERNPPPRPAGWLAGALFDLLERGARVLVVFDDSNPILPAFVESLDRDRRRLVESGRFEVEVLTGADHIFSPLVSQEQLTAILGRTLDAWTRPPGAPP
jgi:dienelactone hydrolase